MSSSRSRSAVIAALALAASLALTACGASGEAKPKDDGDKGAFPVSITHALGTAEIPEQPERVVTIGWGTSDTVLSLGIMPVAIEADTWAGDKDGFLPWFREAAEKTGEKLPTTFNTYPELDLDSIIEADPDLILAPQSGLTQEQYDQLKDLAPTVAYPEAAWQTNYVDQIEIIGKALGKTDEAAKLLDGIDSQLADAAKEHPEFDGVSFAFVYAGEPGTLSAYQAGDPRVDLLVKLGLVETPAISDLELSEGTFTTTLGLENAKLLDDADLLFTWYNSEDEKKATNAQPLFAQIPAVKRGSTVEFIDREFGMAASVLTPLTVPWVLDAYLPLIQDAVSKAPKK